MKHDKAKSVLQVSKLNDGIVCWMGFCDNEPSFYRDENYYSGVLKGDIFKTKKEARKCYQDVRKVTIEWTLVSIDSSEL